MKHTKTLIAVFFAATASGATLAQSTLDSPIPNNAPHAQGLPPKGPAGNVDRVLEQIAKRLTPGPDQIDTQAEANITRDLNLTRSSGQILKPIGFMQVGDDRSVFASEDGQRVIRLKEKSRIGVMKIVQISEDGVEYTTSGKGMYAPMAYVASDAPRVKPFGNSQTNSTAFNPSADAFTGFSGQSQPIASPTPSSTTPPTSAGW